MIEREKVIKGLTVCTKPGTRGCFYDIKECPYDNNGCRMALMRDALALLKEQETVEPIKKEMVEITARYEFDCPCGAPLLIGQPYCADCGKLVKWDA